MDSITEIMQLCRLCLVKDEVNIPIFEEHGDIRQILLKISACLPVKVSKEDNLPKNICDGCSCKLDMLYQFWNTSANSEKKLIRWMDQIGVDKLSDKDETAIANSLHPQHSISSNPMILKQEVVDVADNQSTGDDLVPDDLNVSNDAQDYIMQQQQLPYQPVEFQFQQDGFETVAAEDESSNVEVESQPTKRKRRAAAMKALANMESEDEDDPDLINKKIAKTEEQSDDSAGEDPEPTTFVGLPSADDEQPGPSGIGKSSSDAPSPFLRDSRKTKGDSAMLYKKFGIKPCTVFLDNMGQTAFSYIKGAPSEEPSTSKDVLNVFGKLYWKPTYSCDECQEKFDDGFKFKRHSMVHKLKSGKLDNRQPNKCYICLKKFSDRVVLWSHMRTHSGKATKFKCQKCPKIFKEKDELTAHKTTCGGVDTVGNNNWVMNSSVLKYTCCICMKKFVDVYEMREHKKFHVKPKESVLKRTRKPLPEQLEPQFKCCQQIFNGNDALTAHKTTCGRNVGTANPVTNSSVLKYRCSICMKKFADVHEMREHKKLHVKPTEPVPEKIREPSPPLAHVRDELEPQFKCCQQFFSNLNFLCIHMYQTFAVVESFACTPQYVCSICSTTFSERSEWKLHSVKMHDAAFGDGVTDQAKHSCDLCGSKYVDVVELLYHRLLICKTASFGDFFDKVTNSEVRGNKESAMIEPATNQSLQRIDGSSTQNFLMIIVNNADTSNSNLRTPLEASSSVEAANDVDTDQPVVDKLDHEVSNQKVFVKNLQDLMEPRSTKSEPLRCNDCGKNFLNLRSYRRHTQISRKKNVCKICKFKSCVFIKLRHHYAEEHQVPFICFRCKMFFTNIGAYKEHKCDVDEAGSLPHCSGDLFQEPKLGDV